MLSLSSESINVCLLLGIILISGFQHCNCIPLKNAENYNDTDAARPEICIPQGKVRGVNMLTHHNRKIFGFMGIPFAKPPIGNLRFKAPLPPDNWDGILDGGRKYNLCPYLKNNVILGDEDCLYLNVFTPKLPVNQNSTLLPVMMYTNGGGFKTSINDVLKYNPFLLLDKDVILVSPNARTGALGFLSTGDEIAPGNYAIKDGRRALEWVRDNIKYFGGDPNRVTYFGGSSGANVVHYLLLSNSTKGLFHQYIVQSPAQSLYYGSVMPSSMSASRAHAIGRYLGCPTNSSAILIECLRTRTVPELFSAESVLFEWFTYPNIFWAPSIEPDIEGAIIIEQPAKLLAAGKFHDLPSIYSTVPNEGLTATADIDIRPDMLDEFLEDIDTILPIILQSAFFVENVPAYINSLKSYYFSDLNADKRVLMNNLTLALGDVTFTFPAYKILQSLVTRESDCYFASFEYRGVLSHSYYYTGGSLSDWGTVHGDEILYLFENRDYQFGPPSYKRGESDWEMADIMVQLWTSFAIDGRPSVEGLNSTVVWEPYSPVSQNYLRIGNNRSVEIEIKNHIHADRIKFLDALYAATV